MLPTIAREGNAILITIACFAAGLLAASFACGPQTAMIMRVLATIAAIFFCFSLYFFRDPDRRICADPTVLLAPADGTVIEVRLLEEPRYIKGPAQRISIFMSVLNVHVNRSPADGIIELADHHQGKFISAFKEKASDENENLFVGLACRHLGIKIAIKFIAGLIARRIVFYKQLKSNVMQGERINIIRFGSRVDLYVPTNMLIVVKRGDKVIAGCSIVARIKES